MLSSFGGLVAASVGFSLMFINVPLLLFHMFSNLAGFQVLGSHPLSLDSLDISLYCLLVSGDAERAESRENFLPL